MKKLSISNLKSFEEHRGTDRFRPSLARRGHGTILALVAALLGGAFGHVFAQTAPVVEQPVVITVGTTDDVLYRAETFDYTKIAKTPSLTTSVNTAFLASANIGDVRTMNGKPAQGIWSYQIVAALPFRAVPQPGQAVADMDSGGFMQCVWQILSPDGKYLGTIYDSGTVGMEHIIIGGSGVFQGVTGTHAVMAMSAAVPQRGASTSEDPSVRRILGGGQMSTVFTLYPKTRPTVAVTGTGPAVVHSDGKAVSSSNPAQAGETLTLYATGLGPTTPAVASGQPFPQGTLSAANAPVDVLVNGKSSDVLYAGGYAGAVDGYQINFRLPTPLSPGNASLRLTAAWIPGPEITISAK